MQANVELRSCGTFARCQKSSFVLLQPLGTDLTQLVILHNPCHVWWERHTETHFQISIQPHTGLQAEITHETRLKLITWVCRYDISLGCDCSNIMDEIELCWMHSYLKHTRERRGNMRYRTKTRNHSNKLTNNKHNNTLWYTWFIRHTSSSCTHYFISICFTHEHRPNFFKTTGRKWAVWSHSLCRNNNVNSWITAYICLHYCYTEPSTFGAAMLVETSWEWGFACTCNVFADVTE